MTAAVFPGKVFEMLQEEDDDIVSWTDDGKAFSIHKLTEFCADLLPKYFRHNNYSSFLRQLNMYTFKKVGEASANSFRHPFFQRGKPELLDKIVRKKRRDKSKSKAVNSKEVENLRSTVARLQAELENQKEALAYQTDLAHEQNQALWEQLQQVQHNSQVMTAIAETVVGYLGHIIHGNTPQQAVLEAGTDILDGVTSEYVSRLTDGAPSATAFDGAAAAAAAATAAAAAAAGAQAAGLGGLMQTTITEVDGSPTAMANTAVAATTTDNALKVDPENVFMTTLRSSGAGGGGGGSGGGGGGGEPVGAPDSLDREALLKTLLKTKEGVVLRPFLDDSEALEKLRARTAAQDNPSKRQRVGENGAFVEGQGMVGESAGDGGGGVGGGGDGAGLESAEQALAVMDAGAIVTLTSDILNRIAEQLESYGVSEIDPELLRSIAEQRIAAVNAAQERQPLAVLLSVISWVSAFLRQ